MRSIASGGSADRAGLHAGILTAVGQIARGEEEDSAGRAVLNTAFGIVGFANMVR